MSNAASGSGWRPRPPVITIVPARAPKRRKIQNDDTDRLFVAETVASSGGSTQYLSKRSVPRGRTRVPASGQLHSLATLSLRVLARHFRQLFVNSTTGELREEASEAAQLIKLLPPAIAERLLPLIVKEFASSKTTAVDISLFGLFLHSSTTAFALPSSGLPLKIARPLLDRLRTCTNLTTLDLSGQTELTDRVAAHILSNLKSLTTAKFRGCTKVADDAVLALPAGITVVNLGFTAVGAKGLTTLLGKALDLEVLKLASVNGLTDAMVIKAVDAATEVAMRKRRTPLSKLSNLKVRGTAIGNAGVAKLLSLAPGIEHLDVRTTW